MRYFFIDPDKISGPNPEISGPEARHISNVLRLGTGDRLCLFDGTGMVYDAEIVSVGKNTIGLKVVGKSEAQSESPVKLTLAQALLKDRKMDDLVHPLTELGLTRWIPFTSQRTVPRPDPKRFAVRRTRWEKIATEAVKQCHRSRIPLISELLGFKETLAQAEDYDLKILFWENAEAPLVPERHARPESVFIMVGPEGGFTVEEAGQAMDAGFVPADLGPRILRAQTATLVACCLAQYLFGDMGKRA